MVGAKRKTRSKIRGEGRFGRFKSKKSYRMIFTKTPGSKTTIHFKKKKPSKAKCAICHAILPGTIRERPYKMKKIPKTKKRPTRPYGGYLCSKCARKLIVKEARTK